VQSRVVRRDLVSNAASECDPDASLPANSHALPFAKDRLNLQPSIDPQRAFEHDAATTVQISSSAGANKNPLDELAELIDCAWRDYASNSTANDALAVIPPAAAPQLAPSDRVDRAAEQMRATFSNSSG